jgi:hypothetical protein
MNSSSPFFPFDLALRHKGDFMKTLRSILFAVTVLLVASAAQAQQTSVRAKVPFDFVVGDQAYPAGEYSLKSSPNGIPIRVDNLQESAAGLILSQTCTAGEAAGSTKLVFHRLGDHYFLYQIWQEGNSSGRQFGVGKVETHLAQNHEKPELLIVAANISH